VFTIFQRHGDDTGQYDLFNAQNNYRYMNFSSCELLLIDFHGQWKDLTFQILIVKKILMSRVCDEILLYEERILLLGIKILEQIRQRRGKALCFLRTLLIWSVFLSFFTLFDELCTTL